MSRRESVGRVNARTQSASGPPSQQMVSVAVLAPQATMFAHTTGVPAAEIFAWEDINNYLQEDDMAKKDGQQRKKSVFQKAGLTTKRQRRNPDLPPFVHRQIPYEIWRKHYAKDKDGNYKGTHAPAEDCLLKPEDVQKWNVGDTRTGVDRWTRGKEVLPVYAEAQEEGLVPEYEADYNGPPREGEPSQDFRVITNEEDDIARRLERNETTPQERHSQIMAQQADSQEKSQRQTSSSSATHLSARYPQPGAPLDGRRPEDVIAEAEAKAKAGKQKLGWKKSLQKGGEMVALGMN